MYEALKWIFSCLFIGNGPEPKSHHSMQALFKKCLEILKKDSKKPDYLATALFVHIIQDN